MVVPEGTKKTPHRGHVIPDNCNIGSSRTSRSYYTSGKGLGIILQSTWLSTQYRHIAMLFPERSQFSELGSARHAFSLLISRLQRVDSQSHRVANTEVNCTMGAGICGQPCVTECSSLSPPTVQGCCPLQKVPNRCHL